MKLLLIITVLTAHFVVAQPPADQSERCKMEMQKLAYLVGDWKGEATIRNASGTMTLVQTEHIEWKLNGLVMSIEGMGKERDEIRFQAFALVNFNPTTNNFQFNSYVKEGYTTNAYFKVLEENKFEWGFDIPSGGKTRYIIVLNQEKKTWYETGEYSRDGNTWMKFIELNLVKL